MNSETLKEVTTPEVYQEALDMYEETIGGKERPYHALPGLDSAAIAFYNSIKDSRTDIAKVTIGLCLVYMIKDKTTERSKFYKGRLEAVLEALKEEEDLAVNPYLYDLAAFLE